MKRHLLFLFGLFLLDAPLYAQFGEEFRSEPKHRFGKMAKGFLMEDDLRATFRDMNRNGIRDRIQLRPDGQGGAVLLVLDGLAQTPMWRFPLSDVLGVDDVDLIGFVDFKGDGSVSVLMLDGKGNDVLTEELVFIVDPATNAVEFDSRANGIIAILIGLFDVDRDGRPEMIFGDGSVRQIIVVGWMGSGAAAGAPHDTAPMLARQGIVDYQIQLKFESGPHHELAFDAEAYERASDLDVDGDGGIDIVLLAENQNDEPAGLMVRNGATREVIWQFAFPQEYLEDLTRGFHGFFDVNGDGEKEALFGDHSAVTLDGVVHPLDPNLQILAVTDVDNDSVPDLVGRGVADSTVQVWGIEIATAITENDLRAAGFQLYQNYPNPFNPSTTISYSLAQPGEVQLKIFNMLGQKVRTLVNGHESAGAFRVSWDGRDDAGTVLSSGTYFYELRAPGQQATRSMLLMK
jgi:hypothetical protein